MLVSFDADAGVAYVEVKEGDVAKTKEIAPEVFADFDKKGDLLGIEFLDP